MVYISILFAAFAVLEISNARTDKQKQRRLLRQKSRASSAQQKQKTSDVEKIAGYSKIQWSESFRKEAKTMTGFGEMIFQNGMEQGEKSIVEYMMKTGKYSLEEISAITGVSMETVEKISAGQVYGSEPRD